jgi:flavin-dependent dehydrogenase
MQSNSGGPIPDRTRVLVIGGGPGGSSTAALLAREGVEVTIFEREQHPRYHIGESLLLSVVPILEFSGALEKVRAHGFVRKPGGVFKLKHDAPAGYLDFSRSRHQNAYQVIRSEFDQLLFEHARESGALAFEHTLVNEVIFENERPVRANWIGPDERRGTIEFDHLVDATGLQGLLSTRYFKNRVLQPAFMNVALVEYRRNTKRIEGARAGAILIESLADGSGWAWVIPLHDGTDSIGVVIHRDEFSRLRREHESNAAVFRHALGLAAECRALVGEGEPCSDVHVFQDYSYAATSFAGPGWRLAGDAAGFIDPFFSSGVHLALLGALSTAATITSVVRGEIAEPEAASYHEKLIRRAYLRMMFAVNAVYRQIRAQDRLVLPEVDAQDFQRAFDILQPLVAGNIDASRDEVPEAAMERVMDYLGHGLLEAHGFDSGSRVSKVMGKRIQSFELHDIAPDEAIDGLHIHMKRGELGLRRLGGLASMAQDLRRGAAKLGLRTVARMDAREGEP